MARWTFLLWFELPSELDAIESGEQFLSSDLRHLLLERLLREDGRWVLRRNRMGSPAGHGEKQTWLVFISAEGQTSIGVETSLREQVGDLVSQHVPGAQLSWVLDVSAEWS